MKSFLFILAMLSGVAFGDLDDNDDHLICKAVLLFPFIEDQMLSAIEGQLQEYVDREVQFQLPGQKARRGRIYTVGKTGLRVPELEKAPLMRAGGIKNHPVVQRFGRVLYLVAIETDDGDLHLMSLTHAEILKYFDGINNVLVGRNWARLE